MSYQDNYTSDVTGTLPYQRCLIPGLPEDTQHTIYDVTNFIFVPIVMLLAFLSFTSNFLVMAALIRVKSLRHPSLLLLGSLSITDILFAVYAFVEGLARYMYEAFCPEENGDLERGFVVLCNISTMSNLAFISKDRHLAVSKPWWYRAHVKRSSVLKQSSAIWFYSFFMSGMIFASSYFTIIHFPVLSLISLSYIISIVIMIASYVGIFIANKRHRRTMQQHRGQVSAILEQEKKLANTVGLIVITLFFTVLPGLILPVVLKLLGLSPTENIPFGPFFSFLLTLNGFLNPLLNYGRNEGVRRAVRGLVGCSCIVTHRVQPSTNNGHNQGSGTVNPTSNIAQNATNMQELVGQPSSQTQD